MDGLMGSGYDYASETRTSINKISDEHDFVNYDKLAIISARE